MFYATPHCPLLHRMKFCSLHMKMLCDTKLNNFESSCLIDLKLSRLIPNEEYSCNFFAED